MRQTRQILCICAAAALILLAGCASRGAGGFELSRQQRLAMEQAVDQVRPGLVRIYVVEPNYMEGREMKFVASGSGAIITPEGHVITNHHVAGKAIRLVCTMPNREEIPAELVGTDAATDIAIIKLLPPDDRTFEHVRFGDSSQIQVGDMVLALGSPLGLSQSVTMGIVSNTEMILPRRSWGLELDGENVGELVRWFAHDAQILPGNSGGPLVNMDGEIVGVNEISYGLSGAIPGNLAKKVAQEIINKGNVERAWVGVFFQPLLKSSPVSRGVLISGVLKDSPALRAGLQPGDILLSLDGREFHAPYHEDLPAINNHVADLPIGVELLARVHRDGAEIDVPITPDLRQPARTDTHPLREWGMTARNLTLFTQLSLAREQRAGVMVTSTSPGGPCSQAKPEIRSGDIIVSVNGEPVATVEELKEKTATILEGREGRVDTLVGYERNAESYLTVAKIGIEELDDPGAEIRRAWLPMETQVVTRDLAERLGDTNLKGVRVTRIYPDRPEGYPFEIGDIITHLDGDAIEASQPHDAEVFRTLVRQYRIGTEAEFTVLREGERKNVATELLPAPRIAREMERHRDLDFEFVLRAATYIDRQDPKLQGVNVAVLAESVTSGGWAALADLRVNDVVLAIDGEEIAGLQDVDRIMKRVREQKPVRLVFQVRRGIQNLFLEMEPIWTK